jgi:hypothetical protein
MLLAGLKLPGLDDGVFNRVGVPVLQISDDNHVLGEAAWHRERLGKRSQQQIANVERGADDNLALVELPSDQAMSTTTEEPDPPSCMNLATVVTYA